MNLSISKNQILMALSVTLLNMGCGRSSIEGASSDSTSEQLSSLRLEDPCVNESETLLEMTRCGSVSSIRLSQSDYTNQDLRGVRIERSGFSGGRFNHANLDRAHIAFSGFQLSNFTGAQARGATFDHVGLVEVNFQDADLRGAVFISTNMMRANFKGADLRGISFDSETKFNWAVYDQTTCLPFSEEEAQWRGMSKEILDDVDERECSVH